MTKKLFCHLLFWGSLSLPWSAQAQWLLASPETKLVTGSPFTLTVVSEDKTKSMPEKLTVRLQSGTHSTTVVMDAEGTPPSGTTRQNYRGIWPADWVGATTLQLVEVNSTPLLLVADNAPWVNHEDPVARMTGAPVGTRETPRDAALSANEPTYFLVGANGGANARIQLSFKYRIFDHQSAVVQNAPIFGGLYFGYTQTSVWDLSSNSAPFYDTSYRPSVFYQVSTHTPEAEHKVAFQLGLEHESNGKNAENSRSINTAFARLDWRKKLDEDGTYFGFIPKAWAYLERSDNPDIQRYRGFADVGLRYGQEHGWVGQLNMRRGKGGRGSTQFDLSYPISQRIFADTGAFFHIQYFDGEGATLLDYNTNRHPQLRMGISLVR